MEPGWKQETHLEAESDMQRRQKTAKRAPYPTAGLINSEALPSVSKSRKHGNSGAIGSMKALPECKRVIRAVLVRLEDNALDSQFRYRLILIHFNREPTVNHQEKQQKRQGQFHFDQ